MILYPAIDLKGGKCVRLLQGDFDRESVYGDSPVEMARRWEREGALWLHTVDLDGALEAKSVNGGAIAQICAETGLTVQTGGGIRSLQNIEEKLACGVARVILGTAAVENEALVKEAVQKYGSRIAVGIDAKGGFVATAGWKNVSTLRAVEFGKRMAALGVETLIYTDIATDGMLGGCNVAAMEEMVRETGLSVIASGGIGKAEDIRALHGTGVSGVIVGKALYEGTVTLKDALSAAKE